MKSDEFHLDSWIRLIAIFSVTILSACGGTGPETALKYGGRFLPARVFTGESFGRRIVLDRNGNIRETATVRRNCNWKDETQGVCREKVTRYLPPPGRKNIIRGENTIRWKVEYRDNGTMRVFRKDDYGHMSGETYGSILSLEGDALLPGESGRDAHLELRYYLLPGENPRLYVTEDYSVIGITIGEARTFWSLHNDLSNK